MKGELGPASGDLDNKRVQTAEHLPGHRYERLIGIAVESEIVRRVVVVIIVGVVGGRVIAVGTVTVHDRVKEGMAFARPQGRNAVTLKLRA